MADRQITSTNGGFRRHPKSSHPAGPRDKSKYNNRSGHFSNQNEEENPNEQQEKRATFISQKELTEFLTAKLRNNKFVEVKIKEITNARGILYEIDVINQGLSRIGHGIFFNIKIHTVSHKFRTAFIQINFNDNEARNADMRINADAIIQIFREIAPDTIDSVSITDVVDSKGNTHLAVIASTVKGASLNYTYERVMEFVHVVDEKYGSSNSASAIDDNVEDDISTAKDMTSDQIDAEAALLEKKLKALQELKLAKSSQSSQSSHESASSDEPTDTTTTGKTQPRPRPSKITVTVDGKTTTMRVKRPDGK